MNQFTDFLEEESNALAHGSVMLLFFFLSEMCQLVTFIMEEK